MMNFKVKLTKINEWLDLLLGYNDDKINKLLLNNVLHGWENQAYLQGFGSKEQTNHIEINLFERMIITKQIYAGVMYNN